MKQLALNLAGPAAPTLDGFVPGRNAELLQTLNRVATRGAPDRFVYLWGAVGSGRSHLLRGAVAAAQVTGANAAYVAGTRDMQLPDGLECLDCVAIDDVERLDATAQVALFNLYNTLKDSGAALIVSGDAPPVQLALRADVVTRLGWGLVYQVHPLTDTEKADALMRHAAARGFPLAAEVSDFLLRRVQRDMSSLLAVLDALDRYSLETKRQITVPLARELLQESTPLRRAATQ